ncbi:MAG TPA: hypothetical protein VIV11_41860 [Kofleriaceae bacterium]
MADFDKSDPPGWLAPWLKDECDGLSVHQQLALLLEVARDPTLYDSGWVAEQAFIHPGELEPANRGRLQARQDGEDWLLSHTDGRLAIRMRNNRLVGVIVDHAVLRAAAARAPLPREVAPALVEHAVGIGLTDDTRTGLSVLYGAAIASLTQLTLEARCVPVETDEELFASAAELLASLGGPAVETYANLETWRVWLARHRRTVTATVAFALEDGHCSLAWVAGPRDEALALLWSALDEVASLEGAQTVTARVTDCAFGDVLESIGFECLGP